jgi:carboxyl-terminal processing protease
LRDHLENGNGKKSADETKGEKKISKKDKEADEKEQLKNDYQLNEALNLLKGVNIVKQLK